MVNHTPIYVSGPCTCKPGRYIRFIDPPGIPGLTPRIHCRDSFEGRGFTATHPIPRGCAVWARVPSLHRALWKPYGAR